MGANPPPEPPVDPAAAPAEPTDARPRFSVGRILPVDRDQRPSVYRRLWDDAWESMVAASRENDDRDA